jgi:ATP-dependent Lhr-like helicase
LTGNRLLYLDGLPIAALTGGEVTFLETLAAKDQWEAQNAILRRHVPDALVGWDSLI